MKKYSAVVIAAIALFSVIGVGLPAHAQEATVVVTVPFEFIAGTKTLPAGTYTVRSTSAVAKSPLIISNRDGGAILLPLAFDDTAAADASLSFNQVGDQHLLSQIKTPDGTYSIETGREEKRLTKLAQSNQHKDGMTSSGGQ